MHKIRVNKNQSIWDLANQEYGSEDGVLQLMIDNPGVVNFQSAPAAGTIINIDETKIINKNIVDYLGSKGLKPATAYTGADWILTTGIWNNKGIWDNSELWNSI